MFCNLPTFEAVIAAIQCLCELLVLVNRTVTVAVFLLPLQLWAKSNPAEVGNQNCYSAPSSWRTLCRQLLDHTKLFCGTD